MKTTDQFIRQLNQTSRIIAAGLNQVLESYGIFSSEWTIITTIEEKGSMSQAALANYLNIEPPAISKSIANLERKGLIQRKEGIDKREKTVFLSDKALSQYPEWEQAVDQHRKQLLVGLPSESLNDVQLILKSIFQNAQKTRVITKIIE